MAKFDVTKNVVVPRGEYDDMLRDGFELATMDRAHKQAQAEIEELTQAIDVLNRDKIEEMAAPKPTAEITPRPRAELIQAIRRAYELAGMDNGLHGEAAVNALTHRLFVTGTTTIRERLSRATILAALRDAGIHPLAAEPAPAPGAFLSVEEDRELVAMGREICGEWITDNRMSFLGAITGERVINMGDGNWPCPYNPTPDNPEHLTDAARALLRRVRDERKSTTPKEG